MEGVRFFAIATFGLTTVLLLATEDEDPRRCDLGACQRCCETKHREHSRPDAALLESVWHQRIREHGEQTTGC